MSSIEIAVEFIAPLVGVFVGTLLALWIDHRNAQQNRAHRARILLESLQKELELNHDTIKRMRPAYQREPWGKSFYVETIAWETAVASGNVADLLGQTMANELSKQYGRFVRMRYYVDLLTRLWFAPDTIDGAEEMRRGFHDNILRTMTEVVNHHQVVMAMIHESQNSA